MFNDRSRLSKKRRRSTAAELLFANWPSSSTNRHHKRRPGLAALVVLLTSATLCRGFIRTNHNKIQWVGHQQGIREFSLTSRSFGNSYHKRHCPARLEWPCASVHNAASGELPQSLRPFASPHSDASAPVPSFSSPTSPSLEGLSKFHLSILSRTADRQQFVTGRYVVTVTVQENPTRKWLNLGRTTAIAETELLINGTAPTRSLASLDRFHWLDDPERYALQQECGMVSMELLAEIHLERPGYLQILDAKGAGSTKAAVQENDQGREYDPSTNLSRALSRLLNEQLAKIKKNEASKGFSSRLEEDDGLDELYLENRDRLWVTGFSLAGRQGLVTSVDCRTCNIEPVNDRSRNAMLWPNEAQAVPSDLLGMYVELKKKKYNRNHQEQLMDSQSGSLQVDHSARSQQHHHQDAVLVCDGFLVPTKDRGGLYVIRNPGHAKEWTVCLTSERERWFYHRAVWLDLTGDGRRSILTARCKVSTVLGRRQSADGLVTSGITKLGELVWLECPRPASIDLDTGTPLEHDGTVFDPFSQRHLPWTTRVLASGPDVMFAVADLDTEDDTVEVISSQFFQKRVVLHSIQRGPKPKVDFQRTIDENCGRAFSSSLADLEGSNSRTLKPGSNVPRVLDSGSTVETLRMGDSFSHLLVTSHECSYAADDEAISSSEASVLMLNEQVMDKQYTPDQSSAKPEGGSLFAYKVPGGMGTWKTGCWQRSIVASGFKVKSQLGNMINPGAPGFAYTFYAKKSDSEQGKRPMIAVAGDCAESAYIFRPETGDDTYSNQSTRYKLMVEIQCGATVGSIGIGYNDFSSTEQESGYAKLYIPCYEKDKILVFGLGSGDDDSFGW